MFTYANNIWSVWCQLVWLLWNIVSFFPTLVSYGMCHLIFFLLFLPLLWEIGCWHCYFDFGYDSCKMILYCAQTNFPGFTASKISFQYFSPFILFWMISYNNSYILFLTLWDPVGWLITLHWSRLTEPVEILWVSSSERSIDSKRCTLVVIYYSKVSCN